MDWDRLRQDVLHDPVYNPIIQALEKGEKVSQPFVLIHGVLYYKDRLAIPASSEWVARFLSEYHETPTGGHSGALRTYRRIVANVYWPGMMRVVTKYVAECLVCQRQKADSRSPAGLL